MPGSVLHDDHKDGDSLSRWMRWTSQVSETSTSEDSKDLLADGVMLFQNDERYRNDERYLKLWMRYADLTEDANKVFLLLKSREIATELALFWAAWAYVLEMADSYTGAVEVLAEGTTRGARPASLLEEFQRNFHERMLERMRVACSVQGNYSIEEDATLCSLGGQSKYPDNSVVTIADGLAPFSSCAPEPTEGCSPAPLPDQLQNGIVSAGSGAHATMGSGSCPSHVHAKLDRGDDQRQCGNPRVQSKHTTAVGAGGGEHDGVGATRDSPNDGTAELACTPLGVRHANTSMKVSSPVMPRITRSTLKRRTCGPSDSDCVATSVVIHDPFVATTRKQQTIDSAEYLRWARTSSIVHEVRHESLTKQWPLTMAKVRGGSRRQAALTRTLGNRRIDIVGVLGEGSFAVVYSCKLDEDQRVAVKVERQDKAPSLPWECFITIQLHERLLRRCHSKGDNRQLPPVWVVKPDALFLCRDGCAMTMPLGSSGTLHDLVALYAKNARTMPQLVAMHYAVEMLQFCLAMHSVGILHMDIKPDNWLLTARPTGEGDYKEEDKHPRSTAHSLSLIDFGRAIDLSVFPRNGAGVAFTGKCCASSFCCPAMIEGLAWKYDADLFGLGSCIYFMLHGVYLEVCCERERDCGSAGSAADPPGRRWRPAKRCRRYWEAVLWDSLFLELLNADHQATGARGTRAVLTRVATSLSSYMKDDQRSRQLRELLRRQDNMICNR